MSQKSHVWPNIVCRYIKLGTHKIDVIRDRVFLVYALIHNLKISVGMII